MRTAVEITGRRRDRLRRRPARQRHRLDSGSCSTAIALHGGVAPSAVHPQLLPDILDGTSTVPVFD